VSYALLYYNAFREQKFSNSILAKNIDDDYCSIWQQRTVQKLVPTPENKCKIYENGRYFCYNNCIFNELNDHFSCLSINLPFYLNEYDSQNYSLCYKSENYSESVSVKRRKCKKFCETSCIQEYTSFVEKCITSTQNKSRIEKFREVVLIIKKK
jgi:hypothetical protein